MENLGVFLIILIIMILRGLYRQSQERAQRERQGNVRPAQGNVRSAPRPRPMALPQAPPPKYESIFPVGPSETRTDYESEEEDEEEEGLWNEVESMPEEVPASTPALSPSAARMQEWLQKRSGESQESLEMGPQSGRSKAKEEESKPPVSVTPMMPCKYRRLLENPETIRDAVVLSEIIRRPQF